MIRPLGDRVVIELEKQEEKTISGIILPDSAKEKPSQGIVVAVGNGTLTANGERVALEVSVGDRVIFPQFTGSEVKLDGKEFLVLREAEILAILG